MTPAAGDVLHLREDAMTWVTAASAPLTSKEAWDGPGRSLELEGKVQALYRQVTEQPYAGYHFEVDRKLADRLGYPAGVLDRMLTDAAESFAGVGYFFDLAA